MKWKRVVALLLAFGVVAAACGDDDDDAAEATDGAGTEEPAADDGGEEPAEPTDAAADDAAAEPTGEKVSVAILLPCAINDRSWCQAAYEGVKGMEADGLIDLQVVENAPFDAQGATRVMTGFADEGVDVVIGHSFDYGAPINELAPDYPDTVFLWQGSCNGFCGVEGPNVVDYGMPMHEPAYLAGILAAGITQSNVLGSNAGFDIPVCRATMEAFLLGAQEVNPDITRLDTFLGSWVDAPLAKEATAAQVEQGADVFIACGNAGSFGMIQQVQEDGLSAFGYVYDESELAPENVVGSLAWQIGITYRAIVADVAAGNPVQPYYEIYMKDGGFQLQLNDSYTAGTVSEEAQALFDQRLAEITNGTFEVPFIGTAEG